MRPQTLGPRVLDMAGQALGLEISAGEFDYGLRGSPQLVARDVSARVPGADTPLVEAERVFISLPWSTLRARGAEVREMNMTSGLQAITLGNAHGKKLWMGGADPRREGVVMGD